MDFKDCTRWANRLQANTVKKSINMPYNIGNKLRILDFCQEPLSEAQDCNFRVFPSHRSLKMVKLAPDG